MPTDLHLSRGLNLSLFWDELGPREEQKSTILVAVSVYVLTLILDIFICISLLSMQFPMHCFYTPRQLSKSASHVAQNYWPLRKLSSIINLCLKRFVRIRCNHLISSIWLGVSSHRTVKLAWAHHMQRNRWIDWWADGQIDRLIDR